MRDPNYAPLYTIERQSRRRWTPVRRDMAVAIVLSLAGLAIAAGAWVLS